MQDRRFGKPQRCGCRAAEDNAKRAGYLAEIDGLTDDERAYSFDSFIITPGNRRAYTAVTGAVARGSGLVTLYGLPGRGKSYLLIAAVNNARNRGVPAVYTKMADLLIHLKKTFNPRNDAPTFDRMWDLYISADILAVDEIDEINVTDWVMERFLNLIDQRWRLMGKMLTLFAANTELRNLPEKVESRLRDARGAVVEVGGEVDFRGV